MTPQEFISEFKYKRGGIISTIRNFFWLRDVSKTKEGECGAFAQTLLNIIEGGRLASLEAQLKGRAILWRVRSPLNEWLPRHVALWHKDYGWIDSSYDEWRSRPYPHKKRWPIFIERLVALGVVVVNYVYWF